MTAKEKAIEIINKFIEISHVDYDLSDTPEIVNTKCLIDINFCKQYALICIDEMIKLNGEYYLQNKDSKVDYSYYCKVNGELFEVKQEIEKL